MKKIYLLILSTLFVYATQAQELPNAGFETWTNFGTYEEPESWHTPNPFTSLIGAVTVSKSEDAAEGMYSAMLENILIEFGPLKYYVPGLVTYADFSVDFVTAEYSFSGGLYMPYSVQSISGKYKYTPAEGGDTATVLIYSFAHPEGEEIDTVGMGYGLLGTAEDWTEFTQPMYPLNANTPDTFNVLFMSTNSFDINAIPTGSVMLLDDLSIVTSVGIFDLTGRQTEMSVFPNPATELITFEATETGTDRILRIFDVNGREVKNLEFNNLKIRVNVSALAEGHYSYVLQEGNELLNSGSFIKK